MYLNGCSRKLCPMSVGCTENCQLTKELCPYYTQDIDYQKALALIRSEVAMEIFEDIKSALAQMGISFNDQPILCEIEKKYTEEKK